MKRREPGQSGPDGKGKRRHAIDEAKAAYKKQDEYLDANHNAALGPTVKVRSCFFHPGKCCYPTHNDAVDADEFDPDDLLSGLTR